MIIVDGEIPEYCIKFSSRIEFTYKTKSATVKDFKNIVKFLSLKLEPKSVVGLVDQEGKKYGYELYLSESKFCNSVTVNFGQYSATNFIEIMYN